MPRYTAGGADNSGVWHGWLAQPCARFCLGLPHGRASRPRHPLQALVRGVIACLVALAGAAAAAEIVREGDMEVLRLESLGRPARWRAIECRVEASETLKARGAPTVRVHIPIDFHAGEKKYPIGWPRFNRVLSGAEGNWKGFERFEFLIYTKLSRPKLPGVPLSFTARGVGGGYRQVLTKLRLNRWTGISIPVQAVKDKLPMERLYFNISESRYKHGDKLDFYLGGWRLVRSAVAKVASMDIRTPVVYTGGGALRVRLDVVGPPEGVSRGVPLTIAKDGKAIRRETLPAKKGMQTLDIDVSELKLAPGEYRLIAFEKAPSKRKSGVFRVVEGPWRKRPQ